MSSQARFGVAADAVRLAARRRSPRRRAKQVAMSFIRLTAPIAVGVGGHQRRSSSSRRDHRDRRRAAADPDVCWLGLYEANSVRWTPIAGAHGHRARQERLLRCCGGSPTRLRCHSASAPTSGPLRRRHGDPQRCTYIVMGDATNLAARLMAMVAPVDRRRRAALRHRPGRRTPPSAFVMGGGPCSRRIDEIAADDQSGDRVDGRPHRWSDATGSWPNCCAVDAGGF